MSKNKKTTGIIDFSKALEIMKRGGRVAREGWHSPQEYIYISQFIGEHDCIVTRFDHFRGIGSMTTSWIPNADEICAEDWYDYDRKLKTKNGGQ